MPKIAASERDAFYEERRATIAEVALRLWAERGFDATSVAAIAAEAGISKGAFYLYFESKQALLEDVLRRYTLLPSIHALVASIADQGFEAAVHAFVREAWRHLTEHRDLVLLALAEMPRHLEQAQEAFAKVLLPNNELVARYLEEQVGAKRASEISTIIAGRGLIGMVLMVFVTQEILGAGRHLPVAQEKITATLADVFLHGVVGAEATS